MPKRSTLKIPTKRTLNLVVELYTWPLSVNTTNYSMPSEWLVNNQHGCPYRFFSLSLSNQAISHSKKQQRVEICWNKKHLGRLSWTVRIEHAEPYMSTMVTGMQPLGHIQNWGNICMRRQCPKVMRKLCKQISTLFFLEASCGVPNFGNKSKKIKDMFCEVEANICLGRSYRFLHLTFCSPFPGRNWVLREFGISPPLHEHTNKWKLHWYVLAINSLTAWVAAGRFQALPNM